MELAQHILGFLKLETLLGPGRLVWSRLIPDCDGFWRVKCLQMAPRVPVYRKTIDNINLRYLSLLSRPNMALTEERRSSLPHKKLFINYRVILDDLMHVKKYCSAIDPISDRDYCDMEDRIGYLGYFDLDARKHNGRNIDLEENIIQCIRFVLRCPDDPILSDPLETTGRELIFLRDVFYADRNAFGDRPEGEEVEPENNNYNPDLDREHPDSPLRRAHPTRINVFGTWAWASLTYQVFHACLKVAKRNGIGFDNTNIRSYAHLPLVIERIRFVNQARVNDVNQYQADLQRDREQQEREQEISADEAALHLLYRARSWATHEAARNLEVQSIRATLRADRNVYLEYTYHERPAETKLFNDARREVLERNREASEGAEQLLPKRSLRASVRQNQT